MKTAFSKTKANQLIASIIYYSTTKQIKTKFARHVGKGYYLLGIEIEGFPIVTLQLVYDETLNWELRISGSTNIFGFKNGDLAFFLSRCLSYWMLNSRRRLKQKEDLRSKIPTEFALFANEISYKPAKGPHNWFYLNIHTKIQEIDDTFWNGDIDYKWVSFIYEDPGEKEISNQYSIIPWELGETETGIEFRRNDLVLCKDITFDEMCKTDDFYITWDSFGDGFTRIPLQEVQILVEIVLNNSGNRKKFKINFEDNDFSLLCYDLRIIELYLGVPYTTLMYLQYYWFSNKDWPLERRYQRTIAKLEDLFPFQDVVEDKYMRSIGIIALMEIKAMSDNNFINYSLIDNFKCVATNGYEDEEDIHLGFFDKKYWQLDLTTRLQTIGNLPINVLYLILASDPRTSKAASFIHPKKVHELYSRFAMDKIYFENMKACAKLDISAYELDIALV